MMINALLSGAGRAFLKCYAKEPVSDKGGQVGGVFSSVLLDFA